MREAKRKEGDKVPRGKSPFTHAAGAQDKDQVNLADERTRIMKVSDSGLDQCCNGQIAADMDSMLIVTTNAVQACNDKRASRTDTRVVHGIAGWTGKSDTLVADAGYFSRPTSMPVVTRKSPR